MIETSVLVAALISRVGASNVVIDAALAGRFRYAVSVALALEYEAVLFGSRISGLAWATDEQRSQVLDAFLSGADLLPAIDFGWRPLLPDPGDELVIECALQAGAEAIVTLNVRDFQPARPWPAPQVLRPGEAINLLRKQERVP
jgi:predicted nucleic acid-binding protein